MAELTDEELDAKFQELFPEPHFQPDYLAVPESTGETTPTKPRATVEIGSPTDVSPMMFGAGAGLLGLGLGRPIQKTINAVNTPVVASGTPDVPKKPYTNAWGPKTGYGIGEGSTREQSEAYKKVNPNKKLPRGNINRRWEIETMLDELAKKEALATEGRKGTPAKYLDMMGQKLGLVSEAIPRISTGLGAFGVGYEGAEAYNRLKRGDYPGAAISGVGALGSAASLLPHPIPKAVGTGMAVASPLMLNAYDYFRK
jgi:hypothetical protein